MSELSPGGQSDERQRLVLLKRLDSGGTAEWWLGWHRQWNMYVLIIKTDEDSFSASFRARLRKWMELPLHPNLVPCFAAIESSGTAIILPHESGQLLDHWMVEDHELPERLELAARICDALLHLHQHGLTHGSLVTRHCLVQAAGPILTGMENEPLENDPQTDVTALAGLLPGLLQTSEGQTPELAAWLGTLPDMGAVNLGDIRGKLAQLFQEQSGEPLPETQNPELIAALSKNVHALVLHERKKIGPAISALGDAQKAMPNDPETIYNRALMEWRRGMITDVEALERIHRIRNYSPSDWRVSTLYAMALLETRNAIEAEKLLENVCLDEQVDFTPWMARADAQAGAGHYGEALLSYQEAIHRNAPATIIKRRAASTLYLAGESEKAQAIWPEETALALQQSAFQGACQPYDLEGHAGPVGAVAIDPGGRFGVSVGSESGSELKLWNFQTGKTVFTAEAGNSHYAAVSIGEDGKHFLTGRVDGPIRLWNIDQQKKIQRFTHEGEEIINVALITEKNRAITASKDGQIRSWYLPNASQTGEVLVPQGITHFEVSYNGLKGLSCSGDEWHQWDFRNWSRGALPGGREITAVALSPDGRTAARVHASPVVEIWDLEVPKKIGELNGHTGPVISITYGGNTHTCVTASEDGTLRLWHIPTSRCLMTRRDIPGVPIALDQQCHFCMRAGPDASVRIWDLGTPWYATPLSIRSLHERAKTSTRRPSLERAAKAASNLLEKNRWGEAAKAVREARKSKEGSRNHDLIRLWHQTGLGGIRRTLKGGWKVRSFRHPEPVTSAVLSPNSNEIMTGDSKGALRLWDVDSGEVIRTYSGHSSIVNCIAWHPRQPLAVTGSGLFRGSDCSARIWDVSTGRSHHHLDFQQGIAAVAFSPGGRWVLAGGREVLRESALQLFDVETGNVLRSFEHVEPVSSVCFHPAGLYCVGGSEDTTFVVWEVSTGKALKICVGHEELVAAVSFSPSGRVIASGSLDGTIRIWNVRSWETIKTIEVGKGVTSLAFTPDGRFVITALLDSSIRILELQTGNILHDLKGHEGEVQKVCFSRDGSRAVSASMDGTAAVWELDWDYSFPDSSTDPGPALNALLQCFIYVHSPVDTNTLRPKASPQFSQEDFDAFLHHLQHCGLGWVPAETVRTELAKLNAGGKGM